MLVTSGNLAYYFKIGYKYFSNRRNFIHHFKLYLKNKDSLEASYTLGNNLGNFTAIGQYDSLGQILFTIKYQVNPYKTTANYIGT